MKVLSIRQPWAHLIIHAGKDVENRTWCTQFRGDVLIHASKTFTRGDYEACALFCSALPTGTLPPDFWFPSYDELKSKTGGIVGIMNIKGCVDESPSPWFVGPFGFVIGSSMPMPLHACKGALKFFELKAQP